MAWAIIRRQFMMNLPGYARKFALLHQFSRRGDGAAFGLAVSAEAAANTGQGIGEV